MPFTQPARASFVADQNTIDTLLRLSWSALRSSPRPRPTPTMPAGLPADRVGQGAAAGETQLAAGGGQGRVV